ncbi:hypothetical protein [Pseudomonas frederiksbergensis]|uniref:hypothetical protein n=1 Tax=Pseudomonas frederiksbergensis TaxID=104087 RepID=UPI0013D764AA|nr:hypothetical protein [Pseudomonas frederiksbergensis]
MKNWIRISLPPSGDSPVTRSPSQGPTIIHGVFELSLMDFQQRVKFGLLRLLSQCHVENRSSAIGAYNAKLSESTLTIILVNIKIHRN